MTDPLVIAPSGELDLAAARDLRPELNEATGRQDTQVVIDLSDVTFLDSTALGAVVQADRRMQRGGRRLAVVAPDGSAAATLLELTGTKGRLMVFRTRDAALTGA